MRYFFGILLLILGLVSCSKSSELYLYVKAREYDWKTEFIPGNTLVRLNVFSESQSSVITRLQIQTYTPDGQHGTVIDSVLAYPVKKLDIDVPYTTPGFADSSKVEVCCMVWTQNGETGKFDLTLHVLPSATELETYDSKTLYSAASGGPSCFSWKRIEAFYLDTTTNPDLYFYDVLSEDSVTLSCKWASDKLLFARFEGFNFAQATVQSLEQAYNNSSPTNRISNIHDDDVILIGNSRGALGVVKILLISDKEGVEQDRYVFSIKAKK